MIKKITLIIISSLFLSCTSQKYKKIDFEIIISRYSNGIEMVGTIYNSDTGLLNKGFERAIIKLKEEEKADIYRYFNELNLKNNCASTASMISSEDSLAIYFRIKNSKFEKKKCTTNDFEFKKFMLLYSKIKKYLSEKEEYKEAFPVEYY